MKQVTPAHLQSIDQLKDVPLGQLAWLIENSSHYIIKEGDYLFREGEPITGTHIIISGQFSLYIGVNDSSREIDTFDTNEITALLTD